MEAPERARAVRDGLARGHDPSIGRIVVLASGSGSNLQALLDAERDGRLGAHVVGVVSDRDEAFALRRAADAGVPARWLPRYDGEPRPAYDARLADAVAAWAPDLVVLAGWMRLLTMSFLGRFPDRVVNLHPAMPGELPGTHAIERALAEHAAGRRDATGVMVHFVPDEGVDSGPVIASRRVPILPGDDLEALAARMHATEHDLLVDAVAGWFADRAAERADQPAPRPDPHASSRGAAWNR